MPSRNRQPTEQDEGDTSWPVVDGSYRIGDPTAPIAICVLTSDELIGPLAHVPGVAIAGQVQTANLGIERIILNVTANPSIRFLLLCGKESRLFRPGQTLGALLDNGIDSEGRVAGAQGYEPVLRNLPREQVDAFRQQIELVDWMGEQDLTILQERISSLAERSPGRFEAPWGHGGAAASSQRDRFLAIRPGGQREPLIYDPKGYFVITLDRAAGQIVLRHYLPDHTPAHLMQGRSAESMLLGLLREGLVSQLSHAGYLGAELAKAEAALRLGSSVRYEQDRVLRQEVAPALPPSTPAPKASPAISPPRTWKQLCATPVGEEVDIVCEVNTHLTENLLEGTVGEPSEREPFSLFRRTEHVLRVHWSEVAAVQALIETEPRYRLIAQQAGLSFAPGDLVVVERLPGDANTAWGVPSVLAPAETRPIAAVTAQRNVALLRASWDLLEEIVATSPQELRKGPRGGGRDRDEICRHVIEAERAYARKIGVRHPPFEVNDPSRLTAMREEIADVLSKPSSGEPLVDGGWNTSYAVRRMAWHVVDHLWEIEDRRS